jgi:hypothetical protein
LGKTKESVFRNRDKSTRGSVNLNEALKNKGKPKAPFQKKDAKAVFYNNQVKVSNQGYNRTPAVWKDGRANQV